MTLRWKLVALLVVPLAALAGLTFIGVQQRMADADDARRAGGLVAAASSVSELGNRLATEQALSAWYLASGGEGNDALLGARASTDTSLTAAVGALRAQRPMAGDGRADDDAGVQAALVAVERTLAQLPVTRQAVDALGNEAGPDQITATIALYAQAGQRIGEAAGAIAGLGSDTTVAARLTGLVALQRAGGARADEFSALGRIVAADRVAANAWADLRSAVDETAVQRSVFLALATPDLKAAERTLLSGSDVKVAADVRDRALTLQPDEPVGADGASWPGVVTGAFERHRQLAAQAFASASELTTAAQADARRDVLAYGVLAAATVVFALLTVSLAGRAITGPIQRLVSAARRLSEEELPRLVEALRDPEATDDAKRELDPVLPGRRRDEIGELANAFDAVQRTAVQVAREQATIVDEGVSELFVNLARRNQSLLDRQITFLDQLERDEADPEALAQLFTLDHLATRMRRNAESLLVLAGVEPGRRWTRPLPLGDVVRAAIGEVEDYGRIRLTSLDPTGLAGPAIADVAHLLAELLDNAAQFSPPDVQVQVHGKRTNDGYVIAVTDQGIGMTPEQVSAANEALARPAANRLHLGRTLGFTVVGQLAARHGISVTVSSSAFGGLTATVVLPLLLVAEVAPEGAHPAGAAGLRRRGEVPPAVWERLRQSSPVWDDDATPAVARTPVAAPATPAALPVAAAPALAVSAAPAPAAPPAARPVPAAGAPASLDEALPHGEDLDLAAARLVDTTGPAPAAPPTGTTAAGLPRRRAGAALAETAAATAIAARGQTADEVAGLAPPSGPARSTEPPQALGGQGLPRRHRTVGARDGDGAAAGHVAEVHPINGHRNGSGGSLGHDHDGSAGPGRSPEEIRALLSSYRSGLHRGRSATPREDS
jgi:signal transduction histidine kinase